MDWISTHHVTVSYMLETTAPQLGTLKLEKKLLIKRDNTFSLSIEKTRSCFD
jgi:hypothetical protein